MECVVVENNALSMGSLFGSEGAKHFEGAGSLAQKMAQSRATPEEINAALTHYLKGQVPDGQDPAKGLIIAWGNFFGVPLDVVLSNEKMTPQKAAEIVAGGIPTSEAKLIQFAAAKMYLSLNKYQEVSSSLEKTSRNFNKDSAITDSESGGYSSYDKFRKSNTEWNWPPKLGFAEPPKEDVLVVGTRLDRYGSANGAFLSPKGVPYENRALAPGSKAGKYHEYEVIKPLPILQGKIAPAFDQPRGGVQILPNFPERVNVDWLIKNGYVKEVKNVNYK